MRRRRLILVLATVAWFASAPVLPAQQCRAPRTALVLSGGGAKGLAHIGVLRVLDSLGIRPDLIVGTSMGAVVGALYASGYSGRELDSLARIVPLAALFRTYQPLAPRALGILQPLVLWEQGDRGFALQSASVVEAEANALVNAALLRGNLLARGNFDSLPIPFRAVATDLAHREAVVMKSGDLAQAVRASAAVPLLFAPERRDGRFLTDGGLSANIPVAVARAEGAGRVIVVDATEHPSDSLDAYSPLLVADRLVQFLFQQRAESLGDGRSPRPARRRRVHQPQLRPPEHRAADRSRRRRRRLGAAPLRLSPGASSPARCASSPRGSPAYSMAGANASEQLALTRLLALDVGPHDTLDYELLRQAGPLARHCFRGLRVGVAHADRRGRFGDARSRHPPCRAARRRTRPRL